ncbi:hypothetical protein [Acetobacter okinawensis]|uniref:hypothetical protein n=1 Tax=Acetobacter okinawensis TaxID=1076594 RepID=UPI00046FA8E4|nr:hypothetical protein [Acetobacter okinawensis]
MVAGVSARAGNSIINFCTFIAIKWFLRRQKRQSAADYHYLLVFDIDNIDWFLPGFFTSDKRNSLQCVDAKSASVRRYQVIRSHQSKEQWNPIFSGVDNNFNMHERCILLGYNPEHLTSSAVAQGAEREPYFSFHNVFLDDRRGLGVKSNINWE